MTDEAKPKKPTSELVKIAEVTLVLILLPTALFYLVPGYSILALDICYHSVVAVFIFQAALSYLSSLSAIRRVKRDEPAMVQPEEVPKTTFIVSAYLPNEIDVINDTLLNLLEKVNRPENGLEVILAYNAPRMVALELYLKEMCVTWPELVLANAFGSRSKSENLNHALQLASGEMIVLLDADHQTAPDCLERAWYWLEEGYDAVQGRCKVRNGDASFTAAMVEVEFDAMYGVSHHSKTKLFDSALFGGSNGYWKASVIKNITFNPERLTEDIDATVRAILEGCRIVHDRDIVSTETAPETVAGFWKQRKRWAQGWLQVSLRYQWAILWTKHLNIGQKFMWTVLLGWRVFYDVFTQLLFPIVFAYWMYKGRIHLPVNSYIIFAFIFTWMSGPFEALVAFIHRVPPKAPVGRYIVYTFFNFPFVIIKNMIQTIAIRDELAGEKKWVVTSR